MVTSRHITIGILASVFASLGATYRTANFQVEAPTPQIAQQIGQYAEHYRKEKAIQWLGREMPPWPQVCPLKVTVTAGGSGGATSFAFDRGRVLGQNMHIEGALDRLLASVLPHEVTHTVFAAHYRQPVPRWADEGGSVLSEDEIERERHDKLVRQILNTPGRAMPLRRLFALKEYPSDVMALYAQGYSVVNFLVGNSSRPAFLNFVAQGMRDGWDRAAQAHYQYQSVEELEQAWLAHLRSTKRPPAQLARNQQPTAPVEATNAPRIMVRQTYPPAQPLQDVGRAAVVRGQDPFDDDGSLSRQQLTSRERGRGREDTPRTPRSQDNWMPSDQPVRPVSVQLGVPEYPPQHPTHMGQPLPQSVSPTGYPR